MIGNAVMSEEMPEIIIDEPPGNPGARALAPRERATSTSCLDGMKMKLKSLMRTVRGVEEELTIGEHSGSVPRKREELDDADQLTRAFLRDPATVLSANNYAMTVSADFAQAALTQRAQLGEGMGGPDYYLVTQRSNATVSFYAKHAAYQGARELHVQAAKKEGDPKVYFLPWEQSKLTYCKLAEDADLVLTWPLNGCSVFVVEAVNGESGKDTYLFHVNANGTGPDEFTAAQRTKFDAALDHLWPDSTKRTLTHRLDYSGYRPLSKKVPVEALVYGTRSRSGEWEFSYYIVDVDESGNCERRGGTPDPLPRESGD
jgi:hypothetical protein